MVTVLTDHPIADPRRKRAHAAGIAVGAVVVAIAVVVAGLVFRSRPSGSAVPTVNPAVESVWGIRPVQIAASGDGGFVDFRFVVVDADKAVAMMQDVNKLPVLETGGSKVLNSVVAMSTRHDLATGRTYFLLYRDDGGAVKRGTRVTIVFHDGSTIRDVAAR